MALRGLDAWVPSEESRVIFEKELPWIRPLVRGSVRKHCSVYDPAVERRDIRSEARMVAWYAIDAFLEKCGGWDIGREPELRRYLATAIRHFVYDKSKRERYAGSLRGPETPDQDAPIYTPTSHHPWDYQRYSRWLKQANAYLLKLSPRDRAVLNCRFHPRPDLLILSRNMTGRMLPTPTYKAIAKYLGITETQVDMSLHRCKVLAERMNLGGDDGCMDVPKIHGRRIRRKNTASTGIGDVADRRIAV